MTRVARIVAEMFVVATLASCAQVAAKSAPAFPVVRIAHRLATPGPLVIRPRDLRSDRAILRAFTSVGFARAGTFTQRALAASTPCDYYDEAERGTRCFVISRRAFVRSLATEEVTLALDRAGAYIYRFAYHSIPTTQLGRMLASSHALVCITSMNGRLTTWEGGPTETVGSFDVSSGPEVPGTDGLLKATCPMTRGLAVQPGFR